MSGLTQDLQNAVRAWIEADPDPATREQLGAALQLAEQGDRSAQDEIRAAFAGPLEFGTAGLRGRTGPGPGRMNRAVVIRAAAGLTAYLQHVIGQGDDPAGPPKVVVGYDARHGSAVYARDTAAVVVAAGGRALLWEQTCPTPLLAYAVRRLRADAGVMVTASHNPAKDNGYKVYLGGRAAAGPGDGVQIVPPADAQIAAQIAQAPPADQVPRAADGWETVGADLERDYLDQAVAGALPAPGAEDLKIVHTAMHGVGARIALPVLAAAGFSDVHTVEQQRDPDPDFPTVAFPNPEEPGAMDLALALGERTSADLVIAQDPDADRCAVAARDHGASRCPLRVLTGDELGAVLGDELGRQWAGSTAAPDGDPPTLACSIVSSQLLGRIAADHGLRFERTLTGFKWIARTPGLVFGYEEAIGYCARPDMVRDKDGITAALAVARIAADAWQTRRTLFDIVDDLARRHGLHLTGQVALRFDDPSRLGEVMRDLRRAAPQRIGEVAVTGTVDLSGGWDGLAPTDALMFSLADNSRVIIRPSGTEPKVKCYLEVIERVPPAATNDEMNHLREVAGRRLAILKQATRELLA